MCDKCRIELVDDSCVVAYSRGKLEGQAAGNMKSTIVSRDTIGDLPRKGWMYGGHPGNQAEQADYVQLKKPAGFSLLLMPR